MVSTLPGTYAGLNAASLAGINADVAGGTNALSKAGYQGAGLQTAQSLAAPAATGVGEATGFLQSGVPLLHMGVQQTADQRRVQLQQMGMDATNALDQQSMQYQQHQA